MENEDPKGKEIQNWMDEIAKNQNPKKKLIFDKKTKKLILVSPTDPKADENLEFTEQEATRFIN